MAQKLDYTIPFNDLTQYVPKNLRNPVVKGLIDNLFNRQMTHDESIPFYGYVGRKPSAQDDYTIRVTQPTVDRDVNAVIPVLNFNLGTETHAFTVQDLIRKANVLGIPTGSQNWLYSQANNYLPPIDIDKFANFYNYFWIAKAVDATPDMPWNTELLPEYYTVQKPKPGDNDKLNVSVASTTNTILTGTGFNDQSFTVEFIPETTPGTPRLKVKADNSLGLYSTFGLNATAPDEYEFDLTPPPVPSMAVGPGTSVEDTIAFGVSGPGGVFTLVTFKIIRDPLYNIGGQWYANEMYTVGDQIFIDTIFLSLNYNVTFAGSPGIKGKVTSVQSLNQYQTIDGVQLQAGERVLIKDNTTTQNGIYIVGPQSWVRADDYDGVYIAAGARVWVVGGGQAGMLFTSSLGNSWSGVVAQSNTNDWQEGNFWVHSSELPNLNLSRTSVLQASRPIIEYSSTLKFNEYVSGGAPSDSGTYYKQEKTEFNQLPMFDLFRYDGTHAGLVSAVFFYVEDLTETLDIDLQKRVKLAPNDSSDYVFDHGLIDVNGNMLFYRVNGDLKTIWHAGYSEATAIDQTFFGLNRGEITELVPSTIAVPQTWTLTALTPTTFEVSGSVDGILAAVLAVGIQYVDPQFEVIISNGTIPFIAGEQFVFSISAGPIVSPITFIGPAKGTLTNIIPTTFTQQQVWTAHALSSTTFEVYGSKLNELPSPFDIITVDVPYSNNEFSCLISSGTQPFDIDDTFVFRIGNLETPRYVFRNEDDVINDFYGGELADTTGIGAYQIHRSFVNNPYNDAGDEVLEGSVFGHFRSIIGNQLAGTPADYAFGGAIKNWSEQHSLLASLLMQRDMTPISMIDLSQRQYETGLNTIADIYKQSIAQYFTTSGVVDIDGTVEQDARLDALLDSVLAIRANDRDVKTVLYDTTSGVTGIPATLPQLGILQEVLPEIAYNNLLLRTVLVHHDGHNSTLAVDDIDFRRSVLNNSISFEVSRSDGTTGPAVGSFTTTAPIKPYRGELWILPDGAESYMLAFDVDSDLDAPTSPIVGSTWYQRTGINGVLSIWDGIQWVPQPTHTGQWRTVNLADTLNHLMLLVETRLYNKLNPNARKIDFGPLMADPAFNEQVKNEMFLFSSLNGLLPLSSDYTNTNAFTWNYSQANVGDFTALNTLAVPARWYNVLKAHQLSFPGVLFTAAPHREPWRLLGYTDQTTWWGTLTGPQQASYTPYATPDDLINDQTFVFAGYVRAVNPVFGLTPLVGLQIIDGVSLNNGDLVLLQNQPSAADNGIWIASTGAWTRASIPLNFHTYVTASEGVNYFNTTWALTANVPTVNVDPVLFEQVRLWSNQLWVDVQGVYGPTFKLSVNTANDTLLPPYVNPSTAQSVNALTTVDTFTGKSNSYLFGEGSPVETIWLSTLEYGYSLARALFRHDPMMFLGFTWGFNWVEVDGILYDGYDVNTPGHKRFRLHGDQVLQIPRDSSSCNVASATGLSAVDVTIVFDAYEVSGGQRYQNFSIRDTATGRIIGQTAFIREGTTVPVVSYYGITLTGITIEDNGQPFRIGDSFRVTADPAGTNQVITFTPSTSYKYLGFGQTFTHALRESTIDTTDSFAISAFRDWDVNMGYRAGGLVSTDDLNVRTETDTLSSSSFRLVFKKNPIAKDLWIQGLRITVQTVGSANEKNGVFTPKTDAADWVFKVEGYNPRYTKLSYYDLDTGGSFYTFNVLDQTSTTTTWKQYRNINGVVNGQVPLEITGLQNLATFVFGYARFLEDQGWEFNTSEAPGTNIDAETGRARTWQLEVEKTIDYCYRGIQPDQGHVLNPFMDLVWVRQETGLLAKFEDNAIFDISANAGVFDIAGTRFIASDLFAIRGNLRSQFNAAAPMYSMHAQIDEFEHLFMFNYFVEDSISNGVLYDPFSGSRVVTYKFNGRRQATQTFRPEFGGHYLVGDEVRQNIQASTDNITNFYDANRVFESDTTSRHALALLGFNTKSYFDDLDISDKSQFNFWRGLIQAKGTNFSIQAYLNSNRFKDAKLDEYWAYKIATYGDSRQLSFPELKIGVDDTVQQFTQLQFDAAPGDELVNYVQIDKFDENRWFSIDDLEQDAFFLSEVVGTYVNAAVSPSVVYNVGNQPGIIKLNFIAEKLVIGGTATVVQLNDTTLQVTGAGSLNVAGYGSAKPKYNPIKLFNYVDNALVEEIPLWHPAFGQHTPVALESVNVISRQNPAKYNSSTQVANNNTFDPLRPWGSNEVGRVWFDTRNLSYIPYYDATIFPNRSERLSRWGTLADFATIDVYEWIQSPVPPSEFDALSLLQAGDADLDPSTKAAGEVALQETYVRDRIWSIRPVAWSFAGVPDQNAHPSFSGSYDSILYTDFADAPILFTNFDSDVMSLEAGLFSDYGVQAGMRIGAWDPNEVDPKPLSESIVTDEFTKRLMVDDGVNPLVEHDTLLSVLNSPTQVGASVGVSSVQYTSVVGPLKFTAEPNNPIRRSDIDALFIDEWETAIELRITEVDSAEYEIITLDTVVGTSIPPGGNFLHGATVAVVSGQSVTYESTKFGLRITVTFTSSGTFDGDGIRNAIVAALDEQIVVRDAVRVEVVVPINPAGLALPEELSNNSDDPQYTTNLGIGWRAWPVPTQAQLTNDSRQPNSSWKPYLGDFYPITATISQIQDAVLYNSAPLTLNNDVEIQRYDTGWEDWEVVSKTILSATQIVSGPITITHTENFIDGDTAVYVNGIAQLKASYEIIGKDLEVQDVSAGSNVTVIIRAYAPSQEELDFNPDLQDDLTYQRQFKQDYEYVSLPVRDSEGSFGSPVYYFWVRNKSTVAPGKTMSTQAITQELRDGPDNFLTFQHLIGDGSGLDPFRFDAITISGLSFIVAKDDTFKLRFTRNFTLRDDPQQLDLKDTHTEWSLIRPNQRTRIPETLWQKLVDSMAGQDAAGNPVPSLRRELYDERNGTSTRFGFNAEQTLAPSEFLIPTVTYTIVNTQLVNTSVPPNQDGTYPPDFIEFLDPNQSDDWFETPAATRQTMTDIWTSAKPSQINEIFFSALNDMLANNFEMTDIFKTSRLSAYSIKVITSAPVQPVYE